MMTTEEFTKFYETMDSKQKALYESGRKKILNKE